MRARSYPLRPRRSIPVGVALLALAGSSVSAQDRQPSPADIAAARSLGIEGLQLAEQGDCSAAIEKLQKAESLFHAPTTLTRLGECQIALGKIVAGTENLQRVVREVLPPQASPAFHAAQQRARESLQAALPQIASLVIQLEAPDGFTPTVTVDGEPVPPALLGVRRPTDPGTRTVQASAKGCKPASSTLTLEPGAQAEVRLSLVECARALQPLPLASSSAPTPSAPSASAIVSYPQPSPTAGLVLVGVGALGVVAGSVLGMVAIGKKSELDESCTSKRCPSDQQSNIDTLHTTTTLSTVAFGIGAAGVALGTALLLWPSSPRKAQSREGLRARAFVGLGGAGVTGRF